jgi:hypothetical protein
MSMMKRKFEEARDTFHYFVQCDFGDGLAWLERDDTSRYALLRDLRSGEIKDVTAILECNPVENVCNDVTEYFQLISREGDPLTETSRERARIYDRESA